MANFMAMLAAAGESGAAADAVARGWDESLASFTESGCRLLLSAGFVGENASFAGLGAGRAEFLADAGRRVGLVPGLDRAFWHCSRLVYHGAGPADLKGWPTWERALGDAAGAFYLLVGLSGVPDIRAAHRRRGIPEGVTRDTCGQLRDFCAAYERGHRGKPGICSSHAPWMRNYAFEPYYRLGRLEYWLKTFRGGMRVFRHRHAGHVLALAEDGKELDGDGYARAAAAAPGPARDWTARLTVSERETVGFPYSPEGMAVRRKVRLPADEWEQVLAEGAWVLDTHIPYGGGMGPEACRTSREMALGFFDRHHGESPWVAMVCNSWILNTQIETILPADSNLVRHMRDLYLFPVRSSGRDGLWNIFLQEPVDLGTAPRDTSLQRAVLRFLEAGNAWRGGGMFVLREHVLLVGRQHYRRDWPAALAAAGSAGGPEGR